MVISWRGEPGVSGWTVGSSASSRSLSLVTLVSRSFFSTLVIPVFLAACVNGDSAASGSPGAQAAAPSEQAAATSESTPPAALAVDGTVAGDSTPSELASTATGADASGATATASCTCASGPLSETLLAAVRERFPKVESIRIAEVRSQAWGGKHLVLTISPVSDATSSSSSVIGVHVFDGNFGTLLRTLDVFGNIDDSWPGIHRLAADSVVVLLRPEKAERGPQHRKAYDWRSIEEQ